MRVLLDNNVNRLKAFGGIVFGSGARKNPLPLGSPFRSYLAPRGTISKRRLATAYQGG